MDATQCGDLDTSAFFDDAGEIGVSAAWWRVRTEAEATAELTIFDEWDDAEFGAATGGERVGAPAGPLAGCAWARPADCLGSEAALFASADAFVLKPSRVLANLPVLAAISAVSTRATLLLRLFESASYAQQGAYTLSLYAAGAWTAVPVSAVLPVTPDGTELLCTTLASPLPSFAPALLEKAFAKLRGGYSRLAAETVESALLALTGGSVAREVLDDRELERRARDGELVRELRAIDAAGDLQLLRLTARRAAWLQLKRQSTHGLVPGEHYVVLGFAAVGSVVFARMHSPWGDAPWTGAWAPRGGEWQGEPDRAARLRSEPLHRTPADAPSEWWLPAAQLQLFDERTRCRLFADVPHAAARADAWEAHTAGGPPVVHGAAAAPSAPAASAASTGAAITSASGGVGEGAGSELADASALARRSARGGEEWSLNPQFALTLDDYRPSPAEVTISLLLAGQSEGEEAAHGGAGEAEAEPLAPSLHVLRSDVRGRVWTVQAKQLVACAGPHCASEVSVTFPATSRYVYTIVPSALRVGQRGRFVVRGWCERPFTLEKVRPLRVAALDGAWASAQAGGPRGAPSWSANPQYWLALPRRAYVLVTLERTDGTVSEAMPAGATNVDADGDGGDGAPARASDGVGVCVSVLRGEMPPDVGRSFLVAGGGMRPTTASSPPRSLSASHGGAVAPGTKPAVAAAARGRTPPRPGTAMPRLAEEPSARPATLAARPMPRELKLKADASQLVGEAKGRGARKVATLLNLDGDHPYVIVPALLEAKAEGSFRLTVYSSAAMTVDPISLDEHAVVHGRWTARNSHGCHLDTWSQRQGRWLRNTRFLSNPQVQLRVDAPATVRIRLQRGKLSTLIDESERANSKLLLHETEKYYSSMLGLYVFRGSGLGPNDRLRMPQRGYGSLSLVAELPFVPLDSVEVHLQLKPLLNDSPYVLVPCLFGNGLGASYTLEVTSDGAKATLATVDDVAPPAATTTAAPAGDTVGELGLNRLRIKPAGA